MSHRYICPEFISLARLQQQDARPSAERSTLADGEDWREVVHCMDCACVCVTDLIYILLTGRFVYARVWCARSVYYDVIHPLEGLHVGAVRAKCEHQSPVGNAAGKRGEC